MSGRAITATIAAVRPRLLSAAMALSLVVSACGGGGGGSTPTSPSPPAATTPPPAPPPAPIGDFGPYTFSFDAATSSSDQQLIGGAIQFAHDFFQSAFGRTVTAPARISTQVGGQGCAQGGSAAFAGPGSITFCTANQGWTAHGPVTRQKIVIHELYHVLQFERRWLGNPMTAGPDWIIEGAAEVVGYRGVAARGLLPYATATGCQVKEFTDFGVRTPPGLPNLSALESRQAWQTTPGPLYALAMTGIDQLLNGPGLGALNTYMDAIGGGTPWATAFQQAFGRTPSAFYDAFPAYRAGLTVPPSYLCGV